MRMLTKSGAREATTVPCWRARVVKQADVATPNCIEKKKNYWTESKESGFRTPIMPANQKNMYIIKDSALTEHRLCVVAHCGRPATSNNAACQGKTCNRLMILAHRPIDTLEDTLCALKSTAASKTSTNRLCSPPKARFRSCRACRVYPSAEEQW